MRIKVPLKIISQKNVGNRQGEEMEYIQKEKSRFERDRMSIHVCTLLGNREQSKEVKAALGRNGKKGR